ncbi:MAG TPA: lysophospholipid acyltransferase family protein [Pyrinomonadaceae bacterium]
MSSKENPYPSPIVFNAVRYFVLMVSKILWRIEFHGTENIPQGAARGLLIAPNHQTYVDPFWITVPVKRKFRYLAWDEAFNWFAIGKIIRYLGAFPVRTIGRGGKLNAMKKALKYLREGATLIIFPEGEREFTDGKFLPFKPGAVRIAMEAGVPVMPVTIRGGNKVWAQGMKYPRLGKVEIIFHPPFEIPKTGKKADLDAHVEKINERLMEIIKSEMK